MFSFKVLQLESVLYLERQRISFIHTIESNPIVYDFPVPVWPYANAVQLKPSFKLVTRGLIKSSKTWDCVTVGPKT